MRNTLLKGMLVTAIAAALLSACGSDEEPAQQQQAQQPAAPAGDAAQTPPAAEQAAAEPDERSFELRRRLMDSTSEQEDWVPQFTATPVTSVEDTLEDAAEALAAGRLDQGDDSALALYMSVLETEPDNADATAGIDATVAAMVQRGEESFAQSRFNEAARIVTAVTRLRPDNEAVNSLRAKVESGREIGLLLAEAQRLTDEGRLIEPEGDNAAAIYREVLRTDPQNQAAQQGLARVQAALVNQATSAAEAGNYEESDRLLADAGQVRPGADAVQDASTRIVELRQDRSAELIAQADAALEQQNFAEAERLLAQLEQVSAQAQGLDELRTRIENARNYATLRPGQSISDALRSGGNAPEIVVIPVGSFQMGSPEGEADRKSNEGPRHAVTIERGFAIARSEVTVGQFRAFVNATGYVPSAAQNGSSTVYDEDTGSMAGKSGVTWQNDHAGKTADSNLPVIHVSWNDAKAYADWLSRESGKTYRLPSEAEFEYVLRAGSNARYPWGDGNPSTLVGNVTGDGDRSASRRNWVNAFPDYDDGHWGPAPIRSYEANRFGIHDMNGNVSEWVEDCWHDSYSRAPADGSAWVNPGCTRRVIRGASWASAPDQVRSAFRLNAGPTTTNPRLGFRVARDL